VTPPRAMLRKRRLWMLAAGLGALLLAPFALDRLFPPNLSRTRAQDSDIDLFVSTDPNLTNLSASAIDGAIKSVKRGGSELVVLNNSSQGAVYYVGVKSEDQQGSDFGFFALAIAVKTNIGLTAWKSMPNSWFSTPML
jgi:hypothetical protein